jgi:dihydrofolate synthase/folylpolyglutamate synthase
MPQDKASNEDERFKAAIDYLYAFINYERKMTEVYAPEKMDPLRPARLLGALGNPHDAFPSIHIAGTKGKGSVAAICAECLRRAGYRVGLYTSPHLQDVRERIRILTPDDRDGRIAKADFAELVAGLQRVVPNISGLTWFELVTAIALQHFAREEVDVAVVEVGLGGRLDATNVVTPLVAVITSLSLDHTGLLGNTLAEIAAEKGGIIKSGVPTVSAAQDPEASARLRAIASAHEAPITFVGRDWTYEGSEHAEEGNPCAIDDVTVTATPSMALVPPGTTFALSLPGRHQQENAVVAIAALDAVRRNFPALSLENVRQGLANVWWPGRLQMLHASTTTPSLLIDGAHNADSAQKLARYLREGCQFRRLWLVLGITADKNVAGIMEPLLPLATGVFVTKAQHPRATEVAALRAVAAEQGYTVEPIDTIAAAVEAAWAAAAPADLICVTGSLFVVGDLLNCWDRLKSTLLVGKR